MMHRASINSKVQDFGNRVVQVADFAYVMYSTKKLASGCRFLVLPGTNDVVSCM